MFISIPSDIFLPSIRWYLGYSAFCFQDLAALVTGVPLPVGLSALWSWDSEHSLADAVICGQTEEVGGVALCACLWA